MKGVVTDSTAKSKLQYAIIALIDKSDSVLATSARSSSEGNFFIDKIKAGDYTVMVSFPGMADFIMDVTLKDTGATDIGKVVMNSRFHILQEVIVQSGKAIRMKGDTLEFRADSFPVGVGANVEELLRRLPGFEVGPDGKIVAQGEKVAKILVDGDEFFNDDPTLAQKYLTAKSVDKIQVFDKKSDQALFSGIDDGVRTKTINIKLKADSKKGMFGKISLGTNGNSSYSDEAMLNVFRDKQKVSVFGIGSNTGVTGLSFQDRSQYFDGGGSGYEDNFYGGGQPTAFNAGGQYADKWNQGKQNINFNYRLNRLTTTGWQMSNGTQLLPDSSIRKSASSSSNSSYSFSQRGGGYFEMVLDSFSTMRINMQGSFGNTNSNSQSYSEARDGKDVFLNKSSQVNRTNGTSKSFNSSVAWQHRFRKQGRNISVTLSQNYSNSESIRNTQALSFYYTAVNPSPAGDSLNQQQFNKSLINTIDVRVSYTEPVAKNVYLSFDYGGTSSKRDNDRSVMKEGIGGKYDVPVDTLSNDYTYNVLTHTPGMTVQYSKKKFSVNVGSRLSYSSLEQINRDKNTVDKRSYVNIFPQSNFNLQFSNTKRISISYSGRSQQPSIEQLQPLKENTNPLYVTIGNPNLQPSFSHSVSMNFSMFQMNTGSNFNANISWSRTMNNIIGSQTVDQYNKTISQYINRNSLPSVNGYFGYSRRLTKQGSKNSLNANLNVGANMYGSVRVLNGADIKTKSNSIYLSGSLSFYKNKLMQLVYSASFNYSESTSDNANLPATYNHSHNHNINTVIFLPWKIELASDANMSFQPAYGSFNTSRSFIRWNASVVKKLMKNGQAQIKFSMLDILNQNTGYSRTAYAGSFSETTSSILPRYALLSFTWNFTKMFTPNEKK